MLGHVRLFVTLWTVACQAPLSMGFSRQDYWSGLPFLPAGDLPHAGIKPHLLHLFALAGRFFTTETPWKSEGSRLQDFLKPVSRRQCFQRNMSKAEKLHTDSEKKSPAPQGMSQRIPSFRISSLCSKGNRWRLATFSERAWSQIRQKCQLHMQNKALTRKRESLNRCWIKPGALDYKEILPVHPKGDQSWVFIGRTHIEAKTPVLWPPDVKNWLIWKDTDAGKDWRQEEKGTTEDEMVGWPHQLNGHEFG